MHMHLCGAYIYVHTCAVFMHVSICVPTTGRQQSACMLLRDHEPCACSCTSSIADSAVFMYMWLHRLFICKAHEYAM